MKMFLIMFFLLFNSIFIYSQDNMEKDFYTYLISKGFIDTATEYNLSKLHFLDSLYEYMNKNQSYNLPKICPYDNQPIRSSHETSRCFIEEEIICNIFLDYKVENYSDSFDDLLHSQTISSIIEQKFFRYFCCKFFTVDFYEDHIYEDPLTKEKRTVSMQEYYIVVLILFYD